MCIRTDIKQCRKRGFGIMEVMVAALVLGLLYAAVCQLQKGNRDALIRIRGRDGATEVAQNVIDELNTRGVAYFTDENTISCGDNCLTLAKPDEGGNLVKDDIQVTRTWKGQPGIGSYDISVDYTVDVKVSSDNEPKYKTAATTQYLQAISSSSTVTHVFAKRVDVTVSWLYKGSTQSITVSGVIR